MFLELKSAPAFAFVLLLIHLKSSSAQGNEPKKQLYDFIVVGAGSSGGTIAGVLSKDRVGTVLVLEAGIAPPESSNIPLYGAKVGLGTDMTWVYPIQPNGKSCLGAKDQTCMYSAGRTLGGSSQINSMLYVRGSKTDYDLWAHKYGARGWSYDEVLPFFIKAEGTSIGNQYIDRGYHGHDGPLGSSHSNWVGALRDSYLDAVQEYGFPIVDYNGRRQSGFSIAQVTHRDGYRCGTEKAYLRDQYSNDYLEVITDALVIKIDISEDKVARGVYYIKNNQTVYVRARREVIISAGSVRSPQLLMLSGIGPREHLESFGIEVVADLPVGQNLQDHVACLGNTYLVENPGMPTEADLLSLTASDDPEMPEVLNSILSSPLLLEVVGHTKSRYEKIPGDYNDLQIFFVSMLSGPQTYFNSDIFPFYLQYISKPAFTAVITMLHPRSRGSVTLNSTDPTAAPILQTNYLSYQEEVDILVYAMKTVNSLVKSKALSQYKPTLMGPIPGCDQHVHESDEYFECMARTLTISPYHATGTCKMGHPKDPTTVLDPRLRVKGIRNLRVADCSIMPRIVSGNTNVPAIMIGEKTADMIKRGL